MPLVPPLPLAASLSTPGALFFPTPFPPPASVLRDAGPVAAAKGDRKGGDDAGHLVGPASTPFDLQFGAIAILTTRCAESEDAYRSVRSEESAPFCPVHVRRYPGAQPGGEVWPVVDAVIQADDLS